MNETSRFADGSVGTLLLFEILEHLPHPQKAIAEAHRVLREDGLLGRTEFSANFYDASQGGAYASAQPLMPRCDQA